MASLQLQTFTSYVGTAIAAVQGKLTALVSSAIGGPVLALIEANAALALWLQWLIVQVLGITRASTSTGPDLDSWMGDFGLARLPAVAATGAVTFSSITYTGSRLIPFGALVRTLDYTQTFMVVASATTAFYNAPLGGYLVPAGTQSATLPVQAVVAGTGGNVQANTITLQASSIPGIDSLTNALAFANGQNAESDAAFRSRFVAYITNQAEGVIAACLAAARGVQSGLIIQLFERVDTSGAYNPNEFTMVVDDGSGAPSTALLNAVFAAVDAVRPIDSQAVVFGPTVTHANVVVTSTPPAGISAGSYDGAVQAAIIAYIDSLPIGGTLLYSQIGIVAAGAAPSGTTFPIITLNGGSANLSPTGPIAAYPPGLNLNMGAVRAGTISVA